MDERAVPILPSRDLEETLAFYERLGFELRGAPIETYRYLIVGRGTIELHFWDAPNVDPLTTDASCYLRVRDADALHREWAAIGVTTDPATGSRLVAPVDAEYGMREFALVDPSGNLLRVGSPLDSAEPGAA
jgi:catechol 2,3-dioxygenase-like lactoylglutathione lyase family enzyme